MKRYGHRSKAWAAILLAFRTNSAVVLSDGYRLQKYGNKFTILKANANLLSLEYHTTQYCCGVLQLGNFWDNVDLAEKIPNNILEEVWKIIISYARYAYNKGIVQGWFYKGQNMSSFMHPNVERMFKLGGAKRIGRISFNPNSGNNIKGYQQTV